MTQENNTNSTRIVGCSTSLGAALVATLLLVGCGGGGDSSRSNDGALYGQGQPTTLSTTKALPLNYDSVDQASLTALAGHMGGPGNVDGVGALARFNAPGGISRRPDHHFLVVDKNNKAVRVVSPQGIVTTLFRNPSGASAEPFALPEGVVYDSTITHRTYVSDRQKNVIYSIAPSGEVSLFAGKPWHAGHADGAGEAVRFNIPLAMTLGPMGRLFLIDRDNHAIRTVDANGQVGTLTGQGVEGPAIDDVPANEATFNHPAGVAYAKPMRHLAPAGRNDYRVFISDTRNHVIRYYSANDGRVRILAGKNGVAGSADGVGSAARFKRPEGLSVSPLGDYLAVTDTGNHTIRRIYIGPGEGFGEVETVAGAPGEIGDIDGEAVSARFQQPASLAFDGAGDLVINDFASSTVRKLTLGRTSFVSTLAGSPAMMGSNDGAGEFARFRNPVGIALDANRALVADTGNHLIRAVAGDGMVTRVAGTGQAGATDGHVDDARFNQPMGVATTLPGGIVYVADTGNATLRAIAPGTGLVTTVAGLAGDQGGSDGGLNESRMAKPISLAANPGDTRIYVADIANHNIRVFDTTNGRMTTIAGLVGGGGSAMGYVDGPGAQARFNQPGSIAAASVDILYVLDVGNRALRKLLKQLNGEWLVSTLINGLNVTAGSTVSVDEMGVIYLADTQFVVRRYSPNGESLGIVAGTLDHRGFQPGVAPGVIDGARGMAVGNGRLVFTTAQGVAELGGIGIASRENAK